VERLPDEIDSVHSLPNWRASTLRYVSQIQKVLVRFPKIDQHELARVGCALLRQRTPKRVSAWMLKGFMLVGWHIHVIEHQTADLSWICSLAE